MFRWINLLLYGYTYPLTFVSNGSSELLRSSRISFYIVSSIYSPDQVKYKQVIVDDQENIKRVFATNLKVTEGNAKILFREYGKRWGIETS